RRECPRDRSSWAGSRFSSSAWPRLKNKTGLRQPAVFFAAFVAAGSASWPARMLQATSGSYVPLTTSKILLASSSHRAPSSSQLRSRGLRCSHVLESLDFAQIDSEAGPSARVVGQIDCPQLPRVNKVQHFIGRYAPALRQFRRSEHFVLV